MTPLLLSVLCGAGVYLVMMPSGGHAHLSAWWARRRSTLVARATTWLTQAGLVDIHPGAFLAMLLAGTCAGALLGSALFSGVPATIALALFFGAAPLASHRQRRRRRLDAARAAWPRLIEEIRILTGAAGQSIPQALLTAGANGPDPLRPAFEVARREWLLTTDLAHTLAVLKERLADPAADAVCETLLIAHQLGGSDLDRRLAALAQDRRIDARHRQDAQARAAGARFARRFVLIVPLGMAVAGASIGTGRAAYATPAGQLLVAVALGLVALCWWWAGRIMALPEPDRVFAR